MWEKEVNAREMARSCICFVTRKAARRVTQLYDERLKPSGIRSTQLAVLNTLRMLGPTRHKGLAEALEVDRTTLARNLRPLEQQGLIRTDPGRDLRERVLRLTGKGEKKLETAYPLWEKAQAQIVEELGPEGLADLRSSLSALVSGARKR